jgi:tetratricopeptide (TPR) repeat protein
MKKNRTLKAAGTLLLAAFLLTHAGGAAFAQKSPEADRQAQKGAEYLARKDWRNAADSYKKALRADAGHVEANYGLGVAYMNMKQAMDALAAFSNVVAAQPNPRVKDALANTGIVHFSLGHYKEASDALGNALKLGDIGTTGHYFLGMAYMQTGRDDTQALDSLRRASSDPQFAQVALTSVGLLLLKQGKGREAVAPLEQAARLNPRHAPTQMLLGNAYLSADRPEEALAALRSADRVLHAARARLRALPALPQRGGGRGLHVRAPATAAVGGGSGRTRQRLHAHESLPRGRGRLRARADAEARRPQHAARPVRPLLLARRVREARRDGAAGRAPRAAERRRADDARRRARHQRRHAGRAARRARGAAGRA